MTGEKAIEMREVLIRRGGRDVLSVAQLSIYERELLSIVGPNGAGKSSLLYALARLIRPSKGEIFFQGQATSSESDLAYRRRIGIVFQAPLLFDMSVFDNVATGLRFRGVSKPVIEEGVSDWLTRLGIDHLRNRRATDLSGGEAQRVSLARALVLEPELLLLDEPFSALDPPTLKRLRAELGTILAETGTTTLLVTHDLQEAAQLSNRIGIVLDGRIEQIAPPEELFEKPVSDKVAAFLDQ
ncbi:MAG: ABC transporter ATP-binding protein [Chloroflexota bacterium]